MSTLGNLNSHNNMSEMSHFEACHTPLVSNTDQARSLQSGIELCRYDVHYPTYHLDQCNQDITAKAPHRFKKIDLISQKIDLVS